MKRIVLLTTTIFISTAVFAGHGIFGSHNKTKNTNGVKSIAVELCGVEICPKFRMLEGDCNTDHTYQRYGVCLCEEGYVPKDGVCQPCPEGYYSDGEHECTQCGPGKYSISGSTECGICEPETYAPGGTKECYTCPEHANCTNTSFSCKNGFHAIDGGSWKNLKCVCDDGTTWDETEEKCVSCDSLHRLNGTNGHCGGCKTDYKDEGGICIEDTCISTNKDNTGCLNFVECTKGSTTYYKCTTCSEGYYLEGDACLDCVENGYAKTQVCLKTGSTYPNGCVKTYPGLVCSGITPVCNVLGACETCPKANKDGKCVDCLVNYGKGTGGCTDLSIPYCNTDGSCEACPSGQFNTGTYECCPSGKFFDGTNACVDCLADYKSGLTGSCTSSVSPICNALKTCESCSPGQEYVTLDNGTSSCMATCRSDQKHNTANDGVCICKDSTKENVPKASACMTPCETGLIRDTANGYVCKCPGTNGELKNNVCCDKTTNLAWTVDEFYTTVNTTACGCPTVEFKDTDACSLCSSPEKPLFEDKDGTCYGCDSTSLVSINETESNLCSNRFYVYDDTSDNNYDNTSWLCTNDRRDGKATETQCNRCSNRVMIDGYCVPGCSIDQLHKADRICTACSDTAPIKAYSDNEKQALECSGQCGEKRKMFNGYCAVTYCNYFAGNNTGYFHRSSDGQCFACSTTEKVTVTADSSEATECTACTNREILNGQCVNKCSTGFFHNLDGDCVQCSSNTEITTTLGALAACNSERFIDDNGVSRLCTIIANIPMVEQSSINSCVNCVNRTYSSGNCSLLTIDYNEFEELL